MLDELKGFRGLLEGTLETRSDGGFTIAVASATGWRDSTAAAPQAAVGKNLFVAFGRQGPGGSLNPVQRELISDRVSIGQTLEVAVHDPGDGELALLAVSRSQQGLDEWERKKDWPYNPIVSWDRQTQTLFLENGAIRVRPSPTGITWFDVYVPSDGKWYFNKNNINLHVQVGEKWVNTELGRVRPRPEVLAEGGEEARLRYNYVFPHGARFHVDVSMRKGEPEVFFEVHAEPDTKEILSYYWQVSNGQSEAVAWVEVDGEKVEVRDLALPLKGGRVEVQETRWWQNLKETSFSFAGYETEKPDPNNPSWMGRVLGMKQRITWLSPMQKTDWFVIEIRDQPWQPSWKVPATIPWIEGLWCIREPFLDGDTLTYRVDNYEDWLKAAAR